MLFTKFMVLVNNLGIETIEISGVHRDYVSIQYQNGDRISIPVDQIQMLSKYVASDGKTPKINKLNDGRFPKNEAKGSDPGRGHCR